jgi:glycosyltransferase involved in cell wall biosynthesis
MTKLLTLAIPTFNRAESLDRQLAWIAQAIKGFESDCEIFVSDNCSTDNTQDVINKWQAILSDIPFTNNKNSKNIGLKENVACCINSAKTKYVWTVGDDDPIQDSAVSYVLTKLREHEDLSLLFLNFSGRYKLTGETTGPWFETDTDSEDGRADGKVLFEDCFYKNSNAVIFITSSVYRTERAQQALKKWKEAPDNWLFLAYVAGYCALKGSIIVTKDTYIECIIGVSYWQQDPTAPLCWKYKHIPEVILKLREIGYSEQLYNRVIFRNLKETSKKFLLRSFMKWPILTANIVMYLLYTAAIATWGKMTSRDLPVVE